MQNGIDEPNVCRVSSTHHYIDSRLYQRKILESLEREHRIHSYRSRVRKVPLCVLVRFEQRNVVNVLNTHKNRISQTRKRNKTLEILPNNRYIIFFVVGNFESTEKSNQLIWLNKRVNG